MRLTFRGHDDRYAIEQSLLAFFPYERPCASQAFPTSTSGNACVSAP